MRSSGEKSGMYWGPGNSRALSDPDFRDRVVALAIFLGCANLGAWIWAFVVFRDNSILLGTALLAYALGLRHAVDADHIAAIDNVTRKLVHEGKRPASVGFFFSLGHATIVVIGSLLAYSMASAAETQFGWLKSVGAVIGTFVSAAFLITIALVNLMILGRLYRDFRDGRGGYKSKDQEILPAGGVLTRILRPIFRMLSKPWHMYPIGFLFGLAFDTTTEIAVLGISAAAATKGLSVSAMALFPLLFAVGMTLVDTMDGILMVNAYGWAFVKPDRKLYYNFTITIISVVIALVIGGIEVIGLIKDQFKLTGRMWEYVDTAIKSFGTIGAATIFLFVAIWLGSIASFRIKGVPEA
jgi:nickel/cobalt transporter (NiCoT) family protein